MPRDEHIFLRARRGERFRWHFPPGLFDNIQFYTLVKYPWMEMGLNDSIQCAAGWYPLERDGGVELRWIQGEEGQGFLKTPENLTSFGAEVFAPALPGASAARLRAVVWDRWLGRVRPENVYVDAEVTVERGGWRRIELPLGERRPRPGDEVEVKIQPETPGEHGSGPGGAALLVPQRLTSRARAHPAIDGRIRAPAIFRRPAPEQTSCPRGICRDPRGIFHHEVRRREPRFAQREDEEGNHEAQ